MDGVDIERTERSDQEEEVSDRFLRSCTLNEGLQDACRFSRRSGEERWSLVLPWEDEVRARSLGEGTGLSVMRNWAVTPEASLAFQPRASTGFHFPER